jgi:hypothetical protein
MRVSSAVAALFLTISFSGNGDRSSIMNASAQTPPLLKFEGELGGQKRRVGTFTTDELESLLPSARRYELVEEAKRTLYPDLDFLTDIEPEKTSKSSFLDRILSKFRDESSVSAPIFRKLKIQDLSQDYIIKLIKLAAENPGSQANFAPLFVVGIHGEALTNQEIYRDQRAITVLPHIERQTTQRILTLSDLVPLDIQGIEYREQIYIRKVASESSRDELIASLSRYEN